MKGKLVCCVVVMVALCMQFFPQPISAAAGDLDPTFAGFGTGGKVVTDVPSPNGYHNEMALQPDGKIVVTGSQDGSLMVMRYLSNGAIDTTFGTGGQAVFTRAGVYVKYTAVMIQPDGTIVVAVANITNSSIYILVRLTPWGALDTTFGSSGWVTADFGHSDYLLIGAEAVISQPDGKIIACGDSSDVNFSVARFNHDGSLDTTFDGDGKKTINMGGVNDCSDLALQDDGKIILAGTNGTINNDFAVARLNPDGSLDSSFDGDGKLSTGFGSWEEYGRAVAVGRDGKIVVAGYSSDGALVARYLPNGALDSSFDGDGQRTIAGLSGSIRDVQIRPDGRIVLLGTHTSPDKDTKFALYRLNVNGSDDTSFDGDGNAFIDLGGNDMGYSLALQPDGRILAYGQSDTKMVLIRLWQDATFDSGGRQTLGFDEPLIGPGSRQSGNALAIQSDGKLVVAGQIENASSTNTDMALARFLPDGRLDTSFGTLGRITYGFGGHQAARALAIQSDGKIVVAGYTYPISGGNKDFMVARFNPDGTPDGSFGLGGFTVTDFLGGDDYGWAVALTPDEKIVVAGTVVAGAGTASPHNVFGVARFNSDGTLDTSLAGTGHALMGFSLGPNHWVSSVLVQADGKIVVGGWVGSDFALTRFNTGGGLDSSFGTSGKTITDMGGDDYLYALVQDGYGQIYAAGTRVLSGSGDFAFAHYTADGVLVTCPQGLPCISWPSGKVYADFGGSDVAYALDWRSDGQLVAGGCAGGTFAWAQVSTRYHPGVSLVVAKGTTDFAGNNECAAGVKFVLPNKVVLAGTQYFNGDANFALARFETTQGPTPQYKAYLPVATRAMNGGW